MGKIKLLQMKKLILASLLIFSNLALNAQWIHTSDVNVPNNYISSMAKVGNTVFVGTAELYKTTDNGATWVHVTGIADDYAPIVFANGNNVYVATDDVGDYFGDTIVAYDFKDDVITNAIFLHEFIEYTLIKSAGIHPALSQSRLGRA